MDSNNLETVTVCMKCGKQFERKYPHNRICHKCQHLNARLGSPRFTGPTSHRAGTTPGAKV